MPILFIQLILNSTFYEDVEHIYYNKSIVLINKQISPKRLPGNKSYFIVY
jgi:hypothetical protein